MKKQNVVLSLSGGMDSSTLLLRCLLEYDNVLAVSIDYGQKHKIELQRAQELISYLHKSGYSNKLNHKKIKISGLQDILKSNLVQGGDDVPEGHYENESMKKTVVPNRNKIFASIIQAGALSFNGPADIALGIHAGDHAIYPDCRQEFRDADEKAFRVGNWETDNIHYFTPYLKGGKFDILKDGKNLVKLLNIDFNEVYKRTNTSYKPYPSGNSDYKSASSVERIEAFIKLKTPDPVQYEDETGPVHWNVAKNHVLNLLKN